MHSNYERKIFIKNYILVTVISLLLLAGATFCMFGFSWKMITVLVLFLLFAGILFGFTYHSINDAYSEMEQVSDIMIAIIEERHEPIVEEYREGCVGILYSNFDKMVQALEQSRKREQQEKIFLRDIISDISHQLKTPMASLNIFLDLLLEEKVADKNEQKKILAEAANQLSRMEWMVLSMLKLARIEAGAIQFDMRNCDLKMLLEEAAAGVQYLIKEKEQSLSIDCAEDITLLCDEDWLIEAIINLLKNASDYSENGKPVRIEVEHNNLFIRIYVKDEGPGIAEKELPNIFKRFYRVHQEVNPNSVGIGLSLTKSIVEGMGGSIRVKSEEGKYTWFMVTFVR